MLEVIYSDRALVAVNKPTRLLTVPGRGLEKRDCLYHRLLDTYPDALVVHRLDMDTSGLILFARSPNAQRNLSAQFENREIEKTYTAIVEGLIEEIEGVVELPIRKDMEQRLPPRHIVDFIHGKQAITEWRLMERNETGSRIKLFPKTGRSHQLRVHMQSMGHPIIGDPIYGKSADRLMLHAESLAFCHPATGQPMRLDCPAPF